MFLASWFATAPDRTVNRCNSYILQSAGLTFLRSLPLMFTVQRVKLWKYFNG